MRQDSRSARLPPTGLTVWLGQRDDQWATLHLARNGEGNAMGTNIQADVRHSAFFESWGTVTVIAPQLHRPERDMVVLLCCVVGRYRLMRGTLESGETTRLYSHCRAVSI